MTLRPPRSRDETRLHKPRSRSRPAPNGRCSRIPPGSSGRLEPMATASIPVAGSSLWTTLRAGCGWRSTNQGASGRPWAVVTPAIWRSALARRRVVGNPFEPFRRGGLGAGGDETARAVYPGRPLRGDVEPPPPVGALNHGHTRRQGVPHRPPPYGGCFGDLEVGCQQGHQLRICGARHDDPVVSRCTHLLDDRSRVRGSVTRRRTVGSPASPRATVPRMSTVDLVVSPSGGRRSPSRSRSRAQG